MSPAPSALFHKTTALGRCDDQGATGPRGSPGGGRDRPASTRWDDRANSMSVRATRFWRSSLLGWPRRHQAPVACAEWRGADRSALSRRAPALPPWMLRADVSDRARAVWRAHDLPPAPLARPGRGGERRFCREPRSPGCEFRRGWGRAGAAPQTDPRADPVAGLLEGSAAFRQQGVLRGLLVSQELGAFKLSRCVIGKGNHQF